MKNAFFLCFILLITTSLTRCQEHAEENISCLQSFELIENHQNDTNFIIIDLRTDAMFNEEHLENAICHDVFSDDFENWIDQFARDKTYLLYCNVGHRSGIALNKMKEMEFKNLYHLYEGIREWKKQGYKTVKS